MTTQSRVRPSRGRAPFREQDGEAAWSARGVQDWQPPRAPRVEATRCDPRKGPRACPIFAVDVEKHVHGWFVLPRRGTVGRAMRVVVTRGKYQRPGGGSCQQPARDGAWSGARQPRRPGASSSHSCRLVATTTSRISRERRPHRPLPPARCAASPHVALIGMLFSLDSAVLGSVTVTTPFLNPAVTLAGSTVLGN
jgi:hypothetical protein